MDKSTTECVNKLQKELEKKYRSEPRELEAVCGEFYFRIEELESVIKDMDRTHNKEIRALDMMVRKIMQKVLTDKEVELLMITISEDNL